MRANLWSGALFLGFVALWYSGAEATTSCGDKKPNIVFILTDDQDLQMDSLKYMPLLDKYIRKKGTFYGSHYCTTAVCCPARASILTGKAAHNHNITDVSPPYGGFPRVLQQGINDNYLPIWMQNAGYDTYYVGKLWNAHTLANYNRTFVKGFNGSDFLLDPFTYEFYNPVFQRNHDPPIAHKGEYSTDLVSEKALAFVDEAANGENPFFLGIAPIAPHSDFHFTGNLDADGFQEIIVSPPFPAERHKDLFTNAIVPRTPHFNPDKPSGVYWIQKLPQLSPANIDYNDFYYRQRLRSLQSVDEMVEALVKKLESHGILDNTYIVFTTDNGFHIGQHRLQPGKYCPFEEDVHVPLLIRGPGVPEGLSTSIVTTHTDLAPTFLSMASGQLQKDFDGAAIPVTKQAIQAAAGDRYEHVQVEFWGLAYAESMEFGYPNSSRISNHTYKAVRVISKEYNLYYSVWCTNEHELYDMKNDPYQLQNLYPSGKKSPCGPEPQLLGRPISKLVDRLDALMMVLKTCKADACVKPWSQLHRDASVKALKHALDARYDSFYATGLPRVKYDHCENGYLLSAEGPVFGGSGFIPG